MKSVFVRLYLAVCVTLSGHRAMKGLRRERGECVVLRFTFHSCQPFVMTLASTHCTYVALGLCVCVRTHTVYSMCMREGFCIMIKEKTHKKKSIKTTSIYSVFCVRQGFKGFYDLMGNWTSTFPHRWHTCLKRDKLGCGWWSRCTGWRLHMGRMVEKVQGRWPAAGLTVISLCGRTHVVFLWGVGGKASVLHRVRSPIHTAVWLQGSRANSMPPPLCESLWGSQGWNFAQVLMRLW